MTEAPRSYPGSSEPLPEWEDPAVQIVYGMLCDDELNEPPNREEHWEGWVARNVVRALRALPLAPAQGQPNLKQIEAAIDDHLGNIDATYEDSRRRCAQSILNLYAVPSTHSRTAED